MKTTFTKSKQVLARYLLVSALTLIVAGCSQSPDTQPPPSSSGTIKALVLGTVESDFLEPLKSSLALTGYDGSQTLEDFDMVILDGAHHTPAALKDHALVQEALRTGKWVLALDITAEHKREGLGDMLLSASDGTSLAYAARVGQDVNGRPFVQVVEYPSGVEPVEASEPTALSRASLLSTQKIDPTAAPAFADLLLERIAKPAQLRSQALPAGIPDGLIYQTITYSTPVTWVITGSAGLWQEKGQPQQHPNFTANYTFTVFLDVNEDSSQLVLVEADVMASPKSGGEDFIAKQKYTDPNESADWSEWGWFQSSFGLDINPGLPKPDYSLVLQKTSPENQNGVRTVTTGFTFGIGYSQKQGGNASFNYSQSTNRLITDWKINNYSSGNNTKWYYRTQDPVDNDKEPVTGYNGSYCDQEIYRLCYIKKDPNDLSTANLTLNTLGLWRTVNQDGTGTLVDGWVDFGVDAEHGMLDLYCEDGALFGCGTPNFHRAAKEVLKTYSINLGAVLHPTNTIKSLTFSPNPANGGKQELVTGTITLSKPVQVDTIIALSSDLKNASVDETVTVERGQTSARFNIDTDANGMEPGSSLVANIKATFPGGNYQAQLTITN